MEEQRYWSREDTGITEFLVDIAKIRLGNYLVILAKMVALVYLIFARGLRSFIKELKQPRRRRRVRRQVKNEFIFYERNSQLSRSVRFVNGSKIVLELNVQWRRVIPNGNTKY